MTETAIRRWPLTVTTPWGDTTTGFSFEAMRADGVVVVYVHDGPALGFDSLLNGWDVETALWLTPSKARTGERTYLQSDEPDVP